MMRTIGVIGGMSWESTAVYYRRLNELVRERAGGLHSAKLLLASVDFAPIAEMQKAGAWDEAGAVLAGTAQELEKGGADLIILATNTMHKVADAITTTISIPLIHIADISAEALRKAGKRKPLLLATRFTMEQDFYRGHLRRYGIEAIIPSVEDRLVVHRIIYEELCQGIIRPESKDAYLAIIDRARGEGMDSVIFGCTAIGLLLSGQDVPEGAFDTTELHCRAAIDAAWL
jgi:aspartate racemase